MDFQTAIRNCFVKFVTFEGRASRSEFWYFMLFSVLGGMVAGLLDFVTFSRIGLFGTIFSLATLCPSWTVSVRRAHDLNYSGWWLAGFLALIVVLSTDLDNALILLIGVAIIVASFWFAAQPGTPGPNQYGEDPLTTLPEQVGTFEFPWQATKKADTTDSDNLALIEKLFELRQKGVLTEDEFQSRKTELLGLNRAKKQQGDPAQTQPPKSEKPLPPQNPDISKNIQSDTVSSYSVEAVPTQLHVAETEDVELAPESRAIDNNHLSRIESLERLVALREGGVFTDAEVEEAKARLLRQMSSEEPAPSSPSIANINAPVARIDALETLVAPPDVETSNGSNATSEQAAITQQSEVETTRPLSIPTVERSEPITFPPSDINARATAEIDEGHLSRIEALERLAVLRESGVFTDAEVAAAKAKLIGVETKTEAAKAENAEEQFNASIETINQSDAISSAEPYLLEQPTEQVLSKVAAESTAVDVESTSPAIEITVAAKDVSEEEKEAADIPEEPVIEGMHLQPDLETSEKDSDQNFPVIEPTTSDGTSSSTAKKADLTAFEHRLAALKTLAELRDSGVLTPEEFEREKSQLLGR